MTENAPRTGDDMAALADFRTSLGRLVDRLGRLPQRRLTAAGAAAGTGRSAAETGRELAEHLAAWSAGVEGRSESAAPPRRSLPDVGPFGVGDQLAVTGHDLVLALAELTDLDDPVWDGGARRPAREILADALARVAALRREIG